MSSRLRGILDPGLYRYLLYRLFDVLRRLRLDYAEDRRTREKRVVLGKAAYLGRGVIVGSEPGVGESDSAVIEIGDGAYVEDGVELGLIPGARLSIGRKTSIHRGCVILGNVRIGANCIFSYNVYAATGSHVVRERPAWLIRDQDEAFLANRSSETVWIDDDVWIGWNVFVRSGVHVGRGAVIGANAAVMSNVEPYAIYAGVPARKVGERLLFAPPAQVNAANDDHLPYFYSGFMDDQASLRSSLESGAIRLAGPARVVLSGENPASVRLSGIVEYPGPDVCLRVLFTGEECAKVRLPVGPFDFAVPLKNGAAHLPPLLRSFTTIDLDAGDDFPRVMLRQVTVSATAGYTNEV